jgi:hypothetical protein
MISELAISVLQKLALSVFQDPNILILACSHHKKGITPHSLLLLSTTLKNITSKRSSFKNRAMLFKLLKDNKMEKSIQNSFSREQINFSKKLQKQSLVMKVSLR